MAFTGKTTFAKRFADLWAALTDHEDEADPHGTIPDQAGSSGKYLKTDGSTTSWATVVGGGGGVPEYILIQDTCLDGVDKHIAGPVQWDTSKMIIKEIRVTTTSTDWDFWLLQNDNGYATDDATVGKYQLMGAGNGDESIFVDRPYEDEDGTDEIHLYYVDNAGSASATVSVVATELA